MGGPGGFGDSVRNYLGGLWNAVTGNAQQPAAGGPTAALGTPGGPIGGSGVATPASGAAAAPAAAPAAADDTTGALFGNLPKPSTSFLDNPWVQGALATYLGAISSPRREGLGGAIGHGGLAGLSAYQAAKKAQYEPYLLGAQIAHEQAQTTELGARTTKEKAETIEKAGIQPANAKTADIITNPAALAQMNPVQQQRAQMFADAIRDDPSKRWDVDNIFKGIYGEPDEELKNLLSAKKTEFDISAGEQKLPGELDKQQAEIRRDLASATNELAQAGLTPDRKAELQARVKYLNQQNETLERYGGIKPKPVMLYDRQGRAQQMVLGPNDKVPEGLTPIRPPNAVKTPQGIINHQKLMANYNQQYGTLGGWWSGVTPEQYFAQNGVDYDTGLPIQDSPATNYPGQFQGPAQGGQGPGPAPPAGAGGQRPPAGNQPTTPPPAGGSRIPPAQLQKYQSRGYTISPDGTAAWVPGHGWAPYDPTIPDED